MADFSHYGGVSSDWERVIASIPPEQLAGAIPVAMTLDESFLLKIQEKTNRERASRARSALKDLETVAVNDYTCATIDNGNVPIRVYRPALDQKNRALPVYIWFHGGGFLFGSLDGEDAHCTQIVLDHAVIVVNICYRHTPQWKWPTQHHDAMKAVDWVFENMPMLGGEATKVIVAGRSAGALVAASTVLGDLTAVSLVAWHQRFCGQILDIPWLCHSAAFPYELIAQGKDSYSENLTAPILPKGLLHRFETLIAPNPLDSTFSILLAGEKEVTGLPSTHFHVAGRDMLRDQGILYQQKLQQCGVSTTINIYPGVPHGFMYFTNLEASQQWARDHREAVRRLLNE
ncbi:uncharacterized protein A1O5_04488 [Cladophialophora psammophila CBS 110553]|uniref:Alpha/beta hydrolase fold-3 domain-containing protein n=1 Tax=Cladophialophora psammophila CBS 110553 TaxID=1182543 RepID=W9X3W4_9EURO|nr:uncharacterized protein A1O5_04488 [Cladophialophora psammophila CBS 110553]EXJ71985.1 hypothetical protein A1O5_04488 [Cladophialophora psammophila CBS 110553]